MVVFLKEGFLVIFDFGLVFVSGSLLEGYDFYLWVGLMGRVRYMILECVFCCVKKMVYGF